MCWLIEPRTGLLILAIVFAAVVAAGILIGRSTDLDPRAIEAAAVSNDRSGDSLDGTRLSVDNHTFTVGD
jgi:hypothetical protein